MSDYYLTLTTQTLKKGLIITLQKYLPTYFWSTCTAISCCNLSKYACRYFFKKLKWLISFLNVSWKKNVTARFINICSLQQTPIFNSWHFSEIFWTENKKDAFLVKNQNFEKKKFFGSHGAVFLDSKVGKMPKSAHVKNTQITVKT